jgi:hypothetical protein
MKMTRVEFGVSSKRSRCRFPNFLTFLLWFQGSVRWKNQWIRRKHTLNGESAWNEDDRFSRPRDVSPSYRKLRMSTGSSIGGTWYV